MYSFTETVVLPAVHLTERKAYFELSDDELVLTLKYVELSK